MTTYVGVDFGSETCVLASLQVTSEHNTLKYSTTVLQNELGGFPSSTLVSFTADNGRLLGEAAVSQVTVNSANTISDLTSLLGVSHDDYIANYAASFPYFRFPINKSESGNIQVAVSVQGETVELKTEQLVACLLNKLKSLASKATGSDAVKFAVSLPPSYSPKQRQAFLDAAKIADFEVAHLMSSASALANTAAFRYKVAEGESPKNVLFIDIGRSYSSAFVVSYSATESPKILSLNSQFLGGNELDLVLYNHFYAICRDKYKMDFPPNSRAGCRLLVQCQRVKKVLSANASTSLEVDHLFEEKDVRIPITRDVFVQMASSFVKKLDSLISSALESADISATPLFAIEAVGGCSRIPCVQELIGSKTGLKLSFSLDSASAAAIGAAYSCAQYVEGATQGLYQIIGSQFSSPDESVIGMSEEELLKAKEVEVKFADYDQKCHLKAESKNAIESFILDTRTKSSSGKFSKYLPKDVIDPILSEAQNWLDDEADYAELEILQSTLEKYKQQIAQACPEYFVKVEEDRVATEKALEEAAKEAGTEDKEDHDNRKLKKADRMRLVKINKDEGNSLFRDGNVEQALQRYVKALTHTDKFFDLSEEDKKEVADMRLSLYLNISQCYLKLDKYPRVIDNCTQALAIQPTSVKALFRRAQAYLHTKEFEKARLDAVKAQELDKEDKAIPKLVDRVNAEIAKAKDKEKKMYGKMFA